MPGGGSTQLDAERLDCHRLTEVTRGRVSRTDKGEGSVRDGESGAIALANHAIFED
jgi:hypothetical protein